MSAKSKNPTRQVILDADRPRVLKAGHKALKMITKMTGKRLDEMDGVGGDLEIIDKIAYALMLKDAQRNGETLTIEQVEDILDEVECEQEIIDAISDCFDAAFPEKKDPVKNSTAAVTPEA